MIKIFLTILTVYLLYYAGNIIYDLFLKRDFALKEDENEEYSLTEFTGNNTSIKEVTIDDVEHLNTPSSFSSKEVFSPMQKEQHEPHDLEGWRKKFESERIIDDFETDRNIDEYAPELKKVLEDDQAEQEIAHQIEKGTSSNPTSGISDSVDSSPENEDPSLKLKQQFNQFLSLAETYVQVLADRDGFKVYHSMM